MRRLLLMGLAALCAWVAEARHLGLGLDAFNRAVPVTRTEAAVFSPLSFEVDCLMFGEAVDPIRRALFADGLQVLDDFGSEYGPLVRRSVEDSVTNGFHFVWAHAFVVDEPRRIDPTYRLHVQELYGVEVCRAKPATGVEAWIHARFAGDFDEWRLPPLADRSTYVLHDLVSVSTRAAATNGWKRTLPTHTLYCQPLVGGSAFYALCPKAGRSISSVRAKLTSQTIPEILASASAVIDPPLPVRLSLPAVDFVTTNELTSAFQYFKLPTASLKPFPTGAKPSVLRQTMRFRIESVPADAGAESLAGPFVFFIYNPVANTLPVVGVIQT